MAVVSRRETAGRVRCRTPGRRRRRVDLEPLVLAFERGGSHLCEIRLIIDVKNVDYHTSAPYSFPIEIRSRLSQSRVVSRYLVQIDGDLGWMVVEFDRYTEGND